MDDTFKTALNLESSDSDENIANIRETAGVPLEFLASTRALTPNDVKLPGTCNIVALRESFLSEAPFITRTNKSNWRKWLGTKEYQAIMSTLYHYTVSAISENGHINADRFNVICDSPLVSLISTSMAKLIFDLTVLERDALFVKLPEVLTFMIVSALHSSLPRHHRVYNSVKFRTLLLDWFAELICGIRPCNLKSSREWIFADAIETSVIVVDSSSSKLLLDTIGHKNKVKLDTMKQSTYKGALLDVNSSRTSYALGYSPLISSYMNSFDNDFNKTVDPEEKPKKYDPNILKITLTHPPVRPLLSTLQNDNIIRHGKCREKKADLKYERSTYKNALKLRVTIKDDLSKSRASCAADVAKIKDLLQTQIRTLKRDRSIL